MPLGNSQMNRQKRNAPSARKSPSLQHQQQPGISIQEHQYSGPVPPPEILSGFEQIIPGAAERILAMAEENGRHQREMEKAAITFASDTVKRGQVYGLIIGILAFITCIVALLLGSESTAMTIGGVTIVGLVAVFVTGRSKKTRNSNSND